MPIKYVKIKNFLSHKDTTIKFSSGVNAVIGDSDCGKSAVIKALDWVINNKPSGDEFVSWWAGKEPTSVEIGINGHRVIRQRTKSTNTYQLDTGDLYKAFGQGVPEDIQKVLNIKDVNVHRQPDSPFLLSETSGKVALYINKIANLEKMQNSETEIGLQVKRKRSKLAISEDELTEKKKEETEFKWIDKADKYLIILETLQTRRNTLSDKRKNVKSLLFQIQINKDELKHYSWLDLAREKLNLTLALNKKRSLAYDAVRRVKAGINRINDARNKLSKLSGLKIKEGLDLLLDLQNKRQKLNNQFNKIDSIVSKINANKTELEKLPGTEAKEKFKNLSTLNYNIEKKTKKYNAVLAITERIESNQKQFKKVKADADKGRREFHSLMPDQCPLCGKG